MRLCTGDFVEVFSTKEVPTGSWHCAEVICGNGRTYTVKYVRFRAFNDDEPLTERVPRKALRPSPPPVAGTDNWVPGDHVEVYHNMSWKTATIVKYLDQHIFLVRLLGKSQEFEVHRWYLRVRQSWEGGQWFIVGKGGCAMPLKNNNTDTNTRLSVGQARKRAVLVSNLEADIDSSSRNGVTEIERPQKRLKRRCAEHQPLSDKVDDYIYRQKNRGGNNVYSLLDVANNSFSATNLDMIESNQFNQTLGRVSRSRETSSCASSVGSCSVNDSIRNKYENGEPESLCNDAESFGGWVNDKGASFDNNVELVENRLGLLFYRSALESLYTSGPLSWEDEMKVVDLRDALHISNDEHLVEIKNLMYTDSRIRAC